jgi:hypothetical protein
LLVGTEKESRTKHDEFSTLLDTHAQTPDSCCPTETPPWR